MLAIVLILSLIILGSLVVLYVLASHAALDEREKPPERDPLSPAPDFVDAVETHVDDDPPRAA